MNILVFLKQTVGIMMMNNPFEANKISEITNKIEEVHNLLDKFIEIHKGYEIEILKELNIHIIKLCEKLYSENDSMDTEIDENNVLTTKIILDEIRSKIIAIQGVLERYRAMVNFESDEAILLLQNKICFLLIVI